MPWTRPAALLAFASLATWPVPAVSAPAPAGDAAAGRAAFAACASCHQVGPSARAVFGPPLNGVMGRRAGAVPGYRYSEAMQRSGVVWTPETLSAFVRSPKSVVPGTSMRFVGWGFGERDAADVVAYLQGFDALGAPAAGPAPR